MVIVQTKKAALSIPEDSAAFLILLPEGAMHSSNLKRSILVTFV
ncbi:hypothetical protein X953_18185 [Virgibacillus sp. SK37]|nr:hypothetical protein X953_18185 [Virgibacillus sp. SK37]